MKADRRPKDFNRLFRIKKTKSSSVKTNIKQNSVSFGNFFKIVKPEPSYFKDTFI